MKSNSRKRSGQAVEIDEFSETGSDGVVSLFGKWQTEPLRLPPAVDGIVPKVGLHVSLHASCYLQSRLVCIFSFCSSAPYSFA